MKGVASVALEFELFCVWLTQYRPDVVRRLSTLANGFEGWVKLEFLFWLAQQRDLTIGEDVGLEYKVPLDQTVRGMDRITKQCDLWVTSRDHDPPRYHYVELKAPFANKNSTKLLTSAAYDFWYVSRLDASAKPASGSTIVMGVGFTDETWARGERLVSSMARDDEPDALPVGGPITRGGLGDRIRWAVWTRTY